MHRDPFARRQFGYYLINMTATMMPINSKRNPPPTAQMIHMSFFSSLAVGAVVGTTAEGEGVVLFEVDGVGDGLFGTGAALVS